MLSGPMIILAILLAIPAVLVLGVLVVVLAVFFFWTLFWAFAWVVHADDNAPLYFFKALGMTCGAASIITMLTWGILSIKDWLFSKKQTPSVPQSQRINAPNDD